MSIVRVRPLGYDDNGDPITGTPERRTLAQAFVAPAETADITERGRNGETEALTLYDPANTELLHTDQIEVDGVLYEVDGAAGRWDNPFTGWNAGSETALKRAAG